MNALPADNEDSDYEAAFSACWWRFPVEAVVPEGHGGRFVRWGGLHGRLCLADGHLALEEPCESHTATKREDGDAARPAPLQDYLDELLMPLQPPADSPTAERPEATQAALADVEASAETMAIVLYQLLGTGGLLSWV